MGEENSANGNSEVSRVIPTELPEEPDPGLIETTSVPLTYSPNPPNKIIPYAIIPDDDRHVITNVIINEEGGWVVTSHANDPDGGWTYAGITATTFKKFCPNVSIDTINNRSKYPELSMRVYEIYYAAFYLPVMEATKFHAAVPLSLRDCVYSAAVNLGGPTAAELWEQTTQNTKFVARYRSEFLRLWAQHYVSWVKSNEKNLEWLAGAINRVFRYVSG